MTDYVRSLRLLSMNGQSLAEVLVPGMPDDEPFLLMPTMGMFFEAQQDHLKAHVLNGPNRKHAQTFLTYLAATASEQPDKNLAMRLTGESADHKYCEVVLTRNMQADELADITGLSLDKVRHFLASHLTFEATDEAV